jgi:O-antigen polysaccharide polymerase Wzy
MNAKGFFSFLIFNFFSLVFLSIFTTHYVVLDFAFLCIFSSISYLLWKHFQSPLNVAVSSFCIFSYLFFFIAPLCQIHLFNGSGGYFPNTLPFIYDDVLFTTLLILAFNMCFIVFLKVLGCFSFHEESLVVVRPAGSYDFLVKVLMVSSIALIPLVFTISNDNSAIERLIMGKVIFFIPLLPALYLSRHRTGYYFWLFVLSIAILFVFKNPFIEKRNALGPIYLTLLVFYFGVSFWSNIRSFLLLFVSLVVVFPLISVVTHNKDATLSDIFSIGFAGLTDLIAESFVSLHYDAFSNILAAFYYVQDFGTSYGMQALGALLFFVPRSSWAGKPESSGIEVGDYLIENYAMWFNNLSMPFVAESYLNFGVLGIPIFSFILAILVKHFGVWSRSTDFLKNVAAIYFSFHLIFALRGDLMNGVAYFIGPIIAMYFIPLLMIKFKSKLL